MNKTNTRNNKFIKVALTLDSIGLCKEYGRGLNEVKMERLFCIELNHLGTALWTRPEWLTC